MQRYFIQLSYNGTNYHGWQVQPNGITVQEEIEKGLSVLTRENVAVVGAGRTDTGVHASFFVAHFDLEKEIADTVLFTNRLNAFLSNEIVVQQIFPVSPEDHARFSALSRTYYYFLSNRKQPFRKEFTATCHYRLDLEKMNEAAGMLLNFNDFTSFSKLHTDVKNNICIITKAEWSEGPGGLMVFEITANRFLRNMVRAITGTLIDVGREKISIADFVEIIEARDRRKAGTSVSPGGLFLADIQYPGPIDSKLIRSSLPSVLSQA